jgi:PhoPQ-activated pathogenicity-related protein
MRRFSLPLALSVVLAPQLGVARAGLVEYVKKADDKFAWKIRSSADLPAGKVYDLDLTSQKWEKIAWKHHLLIFQPKDVKPNATMLLYITGDYNVGLTPFGFELATKIQAPVAILFDVPNQPLLGDKSEDALIAETFVRYLETKDPDWPLLFPMVKSAVKAMDALQAFTRDEFKKEVSSFVVAGASKRGWTSWLTGAVEPRARAIAPMVIDTLKMLEQLEHQKKSFGTYSEMIHDYVERGLAPIPKTEDGRKLWQMVDPYFYRDKLTLPKMLICGNNDPYWSTDALNLYWDDLKGDKYIVYVPNAGHDLKQGGKNGDRTRAVDALAAFARCQTVGKELPKLTWKHDDDGDKLRLTIGAAPAGKGARLWVATAPTHDFRQAVWKEKKFEEAVDGKLVGRVALPAEGYTAFYGEVDYEIDGIKYPLCTQIRLAGKEKK